MDRSSDKRAGHRRGPGKGALGLAALALVVALPAAAAADSLPTNEYSLDLFQGPILAPLRVTGIAGAYAGYAEGIPGIGQHICGNNICTMDETKFWGGALERVTRKSNSFKD